MIVKKNVFVLFFVVLMINVYAQKSEAVIEYVKKYRSIAITEMQRTGVPAAIKLAQGIHESMAGQSELVNRSNNHFGIKCKEGYSGPYVLHDDDAPKERFMKYEKDEDSYVDHSNFLKNRSRYASLFELDPTDYKGWAHGLKKAGYATNPKYPQIIIRLIEDYNLNDYTLMALGKMDMPSEVGYAAAAPVPQQKEEINIASVQYPQGAFLNNGTKVIFAKKGTLMTDISAAYNIPVNRLCDINDLPMGTAIVAKDQLFYLQLKRTLGAIDVHTVQQGESLYDIAQSEGIRLESLLKYNNLTKYSAPTIGAKLSLQPNVSLATN